MAEAELEAREDVDEPVAVGVEPDLDDDVDLLLFGFAC